VFVLGLGATLSAMAVPAFLTGQDELRAAGAATYVAARFQRARLEAVTRSETVAVQFTQDGSGYVFAAYVDGNGNGVLTRDIQRAIDRPIGGAERLPDLFRGVEFGAIAGLPAIDPGGTPPGTDPIRLGAGSLASFTASGTASSGTVYIKSSGGAQYAVRVFGDTGKTRRLKFDRGDRTWKPL